MPLTAEVLANLARLGLTLPDPPTPGGAYDPVRILNSAAHIAIQFPIRNGIPLHRGRLGRELSTEQGAEAAHLCALNVLAQLHRHVGFDRLLGIAHIQAPMQTAEGWSAFAKVLDGASTLFLDALGQEAGRHSRSLFGVERLPMDVPIALIVTAALRT